MVVLHETRSAGLHIPPTHWKERYGEKNKLDC